MNLRSKTIKLAVAQILEDGISDEEMEAILKGEEPDPDSIGNPKVVKEE